MLARLVARGLLLQALDEVRWDLLPEGLGLLHRLPRLVVGAGAVEEHREPVLGVAVAGLEPGRLGELVDGRHIRSRIRAVKRMFGVYQMALARPWRRLL